MIVGIAWGVVKVQIGGVLLAAGEGSRLGGPKALVVLAGTRLVERGVALLRAGGTAPLVVVTGAVDVALPGVTTVHNPDWRSGMGSSLAAGLHASRLDGSALQYNQPDPVLPDILICPVVRAESLLEAIGAAGATWPQ